jgi:hypothetical protein
VAKKVKVYTDVMIGEYLWCSGIWSGREILIHRDVYGYAKGSKKGTGNRE